MITDLYLDPTALVLGDLYLAPAAAGGAAPVSYVRNAADGAFQTDSAFRAVSVARANSETTSVAEVITRLLSVTRSGTEGSPAGDSSTRVVSVARAFIESTFQSDAAIANQVIGRNGVETGVGPISDALSYLLNRVRSARDILQPVTDSAIRASSVARSNSESLAQAVSLTRLLLLTRSGTEMSSTWDVAIRSVIMPRTANGFIDLVDSAARQVLSVRSPIDSLLVADHSSRTAIVARMLTEALSFTDQTSRLAHLAAIRLELQAQMAVRFTLTAETALV